MQARNPNQGRRAMGTPIAKSGVSPRSLGSSAMEQSRDSGGNIFNPDRKPKSNSLAASKAIPVTGTGGKVPSGYPGMNTAATNTPLNAPGSGKVTRKVAGNPKFYGK